MDLGSCNAVKPDKKNSQIINPSNKDIGTFNIIFLESLESYLRNDRNGCF